MELYGPDPNSFNPEVFNATYFQFLTQPVSYETLRSTAVTNIAGTTSFIRSKEVNLAGVVVQQGDLEVNQDIIGNASTTITAGVAQIPNITTVSDNLIIQASSPNNIYLGFDDGEGNLFINTNTQSNLYIDGADLVMNNVNQKLRMGTAEMYFNETNKWSANELKSEVININGIDLETKLTTLSNDIVLNKQDADSHFTLVESVASANKTAIETSLNNVNTALTESISNVNTTLSQQISTNQTQSDFRFTAVETTADTNKTQLQTSISTLDNSLTSSINSVNTALTQTINQNKSESDTRFSTVEQTAQTNKSTLEASISSLNSFLTTSINSVASDLTQTINLNKSTADTRMTNIEATVVSDKALLQNAMATLDSTINNKVDANKGLTDSSINYLSQTKADISFVETKVSQLVNGAPEILNTLSELATAIGNDNNFSTSIVSLIGTKTDKTYTDAQISTLQTDINTRATSDYVTTELNKKVNNTDYTTYQSQVAADLVSKVNNTDYNIQVTQFQTDINSKASTSAVASSVANLQGQIDTKASAAELQSASASLQSQIDTKAALSYTDAQLALKANVADLSSASSFLESQINTKSSITYVNGQLALKANTTELASTAATLQASIDTKSSTSYVNEQLLTKVNASDAQTTTTNLTNLINEKSSMVYVDGQLALKANKTYVDDQLSTIASQMALKADKTYVDTQIADIVGAAPTTLDTLQEIANAIAEDSNFSVTIVNQIAAKASKTYVDGEVASLQSQINNRALTSYVDQQLALKGDTTYINEQLALKSNVTDVTTSLASKADSADLSSLASVVDTKSDTTYVNTQIASTKTYADSAVATATTGLATAIYVDNKTQMLKDEILGGASTAYDTLLELQNALSNNSDVVTALTNQVGTKASTTYVDNAVTNLQANIQTDLNEKASITYVNTQIAALPAPPSLTGYATETYVNTAIQNAQTNSVDLTAYATKTYVDSAITDLSGNYASKTYVDNAVANVSVDLTGYATETYVTSTVNNVKSEILGGAGAAYDTLQELNNLIQSGDSSVSTALSTQIATKANDADVVHLTGTETIGGIKTFSNNVTVPSLNNISSTTLGYLDATSSVQTQLNAKANSNAVVDLSTTQTIGGTKTFSNNLTVSSLNNITSTTLGYLSGVTSAIQTQLNNRALTTNVVDLTTAEQNITGSKNFNNLNYVSRTGENVLRNQTTVSTYTMDFSSNNSVLSISVPPASNFTLAITNLPLTRDACYSVTMMINTGTNKVFCNAITINGTAHTIRYNGGVSSINVSTALIVMQTFNIFVTNGAGVVLVASSVGRFS